MKHIKIFEDYIDESIIGSVGLATAGVIAANKLYNFLKDLYTRNKDIPDEKAIDSSDPMAMQLVDLLKKNIEVGRNQKIEAFDKDDDLEVYSSVGGDKRKLFTIDKNTLILTGGYAKTKIKLAESQFKDFENLIHWYKK
jgi:hypothetical protein